MSTALKRKTPLATDSKSVAPAKSSTKVVKLTSTVRDQDSSDDEADLQHTKTELGAKHSSTLTKKSISSKKSVNVQKDDEGKDKKHEVVSKLVTREQLAQLESQLMSAGSKALNNLVHIVAACAPLQFVDGGAMTYLAATQCARRCFLYLSKSGQFVSLVKPQNLAEGGSVAKIHAWIATQVRKFVVYICNILADATSMDVPTGLQIAIIDTLFELSHIWAAGNAESLLLMNEDGVYVSALLALFSDATRDRAIYTHVSENWINHFDDLRGCTLRLLKVLVPTAAFSQLLESNPFALSRAGAAADGRATPISSTIFFENVMTFLGTIKAPLTPLEESGFATYKVATLTSDGVSKATLKTDLGTQKKALSDLWLGILTHVKLSLSGYKTALLLVENTIIPAVATPISLFDFLSDAYSKGGIISVLSLAGIFKLMTRHGLENPTFFKQLYGTIEPIALQSKYRGRFLTLLTQALMSSFMPSYLVAAFCKRLCRVALFTSPAISIYILALIFNLVRRHPVLMNLVNRNADGHLVPILTSLAAFRKLKQKALEASGGAGDHSDDESDDEDDDDASDQDDEDEHKLLETVTSKKSADAEAKEAKTFSLFASLPKASPTTAGLSGTIFGSKSQTKPGAGTGLLVAQDDTHVETNPAAWDKGLDPFIEQCDTPAQSCALDSSFLEIAALMNHYSPDVARLAKLIFSDTAQKQMLMVSDYSSKSYLGLFEEAISYRKNRITPMAYEQPTGILTAAKAAAAETTSPAARLELTKLNVLTTSFTV